MKRRILRYVARGYLSLFMLGLLAVMLMDATGRVILAFALGAASLLAATIYAFERGVND